MADEVFERALHAMSDVQRRSVEAASALVERLVNNVDGHRATERDDEGTDPPSTNDDVLAGFARLWRDSIASLAGVVPGSAAHTNAPYLDISAEGAHPALRVTIDPETSVGITDVWLHNPSGDATDKLRVHCGALQAHDGSTLPAMSVTADPDAFDLPARSSRGVQLSVDGAGAQPGTYRGLVFVEGLPDQWLPLEVIVPDASA